MGSPKQILIVDDDGVNRTLLGSLIEIMGFQAVYAEDGPAALAALSPDIDLVLLDVMMPKMDGYEVVRRIREQHAYSDLPVIMVTALKGKEEQLKAVEAGANDFISKPVTKTELEIRAGSLLKIKDSADALKRHRQDLEAANTELNQIFNAAPSGMLVIDTDFHLIKVNHNFLTMMDIPGSAPLGGKCWEMVQGPLCRTQDCPMVRISQGQGGFEQDIVMRSRTGREFPCQVTGTRFLGPNGAMVGIIEEVKDITERVQTLIQLKKHKEEAERANAVKSRFLANVSHEFRTPLNAIIGYSDLLMETGLEPDQRRTLSTIRQSGKTLLQLINDILDFSKMEAGKLEFESTRFDPEEVSFFACDIIRPALKKKPVELLCRMDPRLPARLKGDPNRFRQVIINLMSNAVKFTDNGEIELNLSVESQTPTHLVLMTSVRDTGIGISDDMQARIFEPFQQADGSQNENLAGTGLGLSISRYLARRFDGDLHVESRQGKGSTFRFSACLEKCPVPSGPVSPPARPMNRVLVVDENKRGMEILEEMLKDLGMEVLLAQSSAQAKTLASLENARNKPIHACLMGLNILRASPFLAHEIQTAFSRSGAPVFIGLSPFSDQEPGLSSKFGLAGMLFKPVRKQQLMEILAKGTREDEKQAPPHDPGPLDGPEKRPDKPGKSVRILLAEDNPVNQKLALAVLEKAGHHIQVASDGQQALEMFFANPDDFHLILMDIQMPRLDGIQTTRKIREKGHHIPIIAMTAHAISDHFQTYLDAGMNDAVSKPFKIDNLLKIIEKLSKNDPLAS